MLGYIIQVPINWGQSNINLSGFLWLGALSNQAEGAREISDNHHYCSQLSEKITSPQVETPPPPFAKA
ncbi:MAG: hypothetical protein RLZZ487_896 [Pseudomonadota bacterium]|jgi:hypothetical protein